MYPNTTRIRIPDDEDRERILTVHRNAFGNDEGPVIANLVEEMLADPTSQPILSLVAEQAGEIVGHVLFTSVQLEPDSPASAQILAPLAVAGDQQGQGIGTQLVNEGLVQLERAGCELVFVLGYPKYYSRFGFSPAGERGFHAPYPIPAKNADAWMVTELSPGTIDKYEGTVRCSRTLDQQKYWQE